MLAVGPLSLYTYTIHTTIQHPHLRQPLAPHGSAKTRAWLQSWGAYPTRFGLTMWQCRPAPPPREACNDARSLREIRRGRGRSAPRCTGFFIETIPIASARSAKTHDDDGQRALQPRADQSSQRNYDELTRLMMVCLGKLNTKDKVCRRTDRQIMNADGQTDR